MCFCEADAECELQSAGKMTHCCSAEPSLTDGASCCCRAASAGALGLLESTTSLHEAKQSVWNQVSFFCLFVAGFYLFIAFFYDVLTTKTFHSSFTWGELAFGSFYGAKSEVVYKQSSTLTESFMRAIWIFSLNFLCVKNKEGTEHFVPLTWLGGQVSRKYEREIKERRRIEENDYYCD